MDHPWFKDTNFEKVNNKELKPPYIPDPKVDHVEPEFIQVDVKDANVTSPVMSQTSDED